MSSKDISRDQKCKFYVKAFKSYRNTDTQTRRHTEPLKTLGLPRSFAEGI